MKCVICGKEFTPKVACQISCSKQCRKERWNQLERLRRAKKRADKKQTHRRCVFCGKEFVSERFRKYCTKTCAKLAQEQRDRAKYWNAKPKDNLEPTVMKNCPKDCKYRSGGGLQTCDYLLITGKQRPKVGGTVLECEVYEKGKKANKGKWQMAGVVFPGPIR